MAKPLTLEEVDEIAKGVADRQLDQLAAGIINVFLGLPPAKRESLFSKIRCNGIFCPDCGWGDRSNPNPNCQCENDE